MITPRRSGIALVLAPLVALVLLAACGSSGGSGSGAPNSSAGGSSTTMGADGSTTTASSGGGGAVKSGDVAIVLKGFKFNPSEVTVKVGSKVTWTNDDSATHTATGDERQFDTKSIKPGAKAPFTFTKPGTYSYHCNIHPTMTATITVQ